MGAIGKRRIKDEEPKNEKREKMNENARYAPASWKELSKQKAYRIGSWDRA
jgi:hypothetical protein